MKTMVGICKGTLEEMIDDHVVICDYVMNPYGPTLLDSPIIANEYTCPHCQGKSHYTPLFDPSKSSQKLWVCANMRCETYKHKKSQGSVTTQVNVKRALEWPLFCEMNGLGNKNYDVKFELIDQDAKKVDFLLRFSAKPEGIVVMQGNPGSGKTYAAIAVCELYTRRHTSAIFCTMKQMMENWSISKQPGQYSNFVSGITNSKLLVVDDFGTGIPPDGFMTFFMDLMNTRLQWDDRGTIVTTNLDNDKLGKCCGDALLSRFGTGQKLIFANKDRRKPMVL